MSMVRVWQEIPAATVVDLLILKRSKRR